MKTLIAIIILFISNLTFACSCMPMSLNERISTSDFIAKAKIKKIWLDEKDKKLHNIEIEIIDLYKGTSTKRMKIYSAQLTSCTFFTPQNTTWLIFASKDNDGILKFGFCSGSQNIEKNINSVQRKINVLRYLKVEKLDMNSKNNVAFVINSDF